MASPAMLMSLRSLDSAPQASSADFAHVRANSGLALAVIVGAVARSVYDRGCVGPGFRQPAHMLMKRAVRRPGPE